MTNLPSPEWLSLLPVVKTSRRGVCHLLGGVQGSSAWEAEFFSGSGNLNLWGPNQE